MGSRERIITALKGDTPKKIPVALSFYNLDLNRLAPEGINLLDLIDIQFIKFPISPEVAEFSKQALPYSGDTRIGNFQQVSTYSQWSYSPEAMENRNPLAVATSLDDLINFPFPELKLPYDASSLSDQVIALHDLGLAAGGNLPHLGGELFEAAWRLRGLENFLLDLIERPSWANFLLDKLTEIAQHNAEAMARADVDVLSLDDDVGMPVSMMISPKMWREYFQPRLLHIIQSARSINPNILVLFHSDGYFEPIIPDLIDIGVNAINPLQPDHMDAIRIRKKFGNDIALWGTVGTQTAFSFNTPGQIQEEVRYRINTLGRGGLVLCPAYDIDEPDIPWENVAAFLDAARDLD